MPGVYVAAVALALVSGVLGTLASIQTGLFVVAIVLTGAVLTLTACMVRPEAALVVFVTLLPVYLLGLVVLYGVLDVPPVAIRALQPVKELVLVAALIGVLILIRIRQVGVIMDALDTTVFAFVALNVLYVVFPLGNEPLLARLAGVRTNATFVGLYVLGRFARRPAIPNSLVATILTTLAVLTVAGVVLEKALLPADWPLKLGYSKFLLTFYGHVDVQTPNQLPWTFWTEGRIFRRPSAFYANPLDMAAASLLLVGWSFAHYLSPRPVKARRAWLVLTIALILTVAVSLARMAIITLPVGLTALALARGKRRAAWTIILTTLIVAAAVFVAAGPLLRHYVSSTLFFENASSAGHLHEWVTALRSLVTHPLGRGLGTSGSVGARAGGRVGGENQYLIIGVELGWLGLILFATLLALSIKRVAAAYRETGHALFGLGLAAIIALAFLGLTSEIGTYLFVAYVGWWLVGCATSTTVTPGPGLAEATTQPAAQP